MLEVIPSQPSSSADTKKIRLKVLHNLTNRSNLTILLADKYYRKLAFAVLATLTPHRQLHAQKWASPFFGFAPHHPTSGWHSVKKNFAQFDNPKNQTILLIYKYFFIFKK